MKRKILTSIGIILSCVSAYAIDTNEICHYTGSALFVLERGTDGVRTTVNGTGFSVEFDYDIMAGTADSAMNTINGLAACNEINVKSSANGSKSNDGIASPGDANTFLVVGETDVGQYCWCKMNGPISSYWVYVKEYIDASSCASGCTAFCANGLSGATSLGNGRNVRDALFDAIW